MLNDLIHSETQGGTKLMIHTNTNTANTKRSQAESFQLFKPTILIHILSLFPTRHAITTTSASSTCGPLSPRPFSHSYPKDSPDQKAKRKEGFFSVENKQRLIVVQQGPRIIKRKEKEKQRSCMCFLFQKSTKLPLNFFLSHSQYLYKNERPEE